MPGQILLAGGGVEDESDLKVIELGLQEEEEAGSSEESEEEDGPGPFSRMYFSFVSPCFCFFFVFFLSILLFSEDEGRELRILHYDYVSRSGVG